MARPLRVEYPGCLYHVFSRGNASQDIFLNTQDRTTFLKNLGHCVKLHNLVCHAYCLMGNHYHLLLETPGANLSDAMRDINGNYTQAFNRRHGRVGHVLQGRYKAFVIEKETYLLQVARYIVLNPIQAGIVDKLKWRWSSYHATVGDEKSPEWLHTDWILGFFSKQRKKAQRAYREFIAAGIGGPDPYDDLKNGFLLGSPQFVQWIWENTPVELEEVRDFPREQRVVGRPTLQEIFEGTETMAERDAAIKLARFRCGYLASEIARYLKMDPSVIGRISRDTYNVKKVESRT